MSGSSHQDPPLTLSRVLIEEGEQLFSTPGRPFSARVSEQLAQLKPDQPEPGTLTHPDAEEAELLARRAVYAAIHRLPSKPAALCFSGGGIRSATFNLGVIQALSKLHLLDKFQYLSTVSGGGYIGGWLTAWIHRARTSDSAQPVDPQSVLSRSGTPTAAHTGVEPPPVEWLREYSNYLTPKLGLFSADSWTMISTALRNLLLTWSVLIPLIIASFMLPRLHIALLTHFEGSFLAHDMLWGGLLFSIPAVMYLHLFRPRFSKVVSPPHPVPGADPPVENRRNLESQGWFVVICLLPLAITAYCLTTAWAWHRNIPGSLAEITFSQWSASSSFAIVGAGVHFLGWALAMLVVLLKAFEQPLVRTRIPSLAANMLKESVFIVLSGALGGYTVWAVLSATPSALCSPSASPADSCHLVVRDFAEWYTAFGVPGFLSLFLLITTVFIGLTARYTGDQEHEFWARTGAWVLSASTVIGTLSALIIFGPGLLVKLGLWTSASIGGIAGILSLAGGFSAKTMVTETDKRDRLSWLMEYAVRLATPMFVGLLIAAFAFLTSALVTGWSWMLAGDEGIAWVETGRLMPEPDPQKPWLHSLALHNAQPGHLFLLWFTLIGIGASMGWCINVNKFSLHGFYRNRLIRAYLGASRGVSPGDVRHPHQMTGFDPLDNVYMAELANYDFESKRYDRTKPIQRPFHIVNIALNLVRADKLAWQQRKAQSLTVSPLHCGSWQTVGYRRSHEYGFNAAVNRSISLGTAIATSGAAASPNMGYHSSAAVTFLLALFNVRLGWWMGNPGQAGGEPPLGKLGKWLNLRPSYRRACPNFSVGPLVKELFGLTDATQPYVYLSDGGHFENLGLYEMVLRRCHHIVVVDAGCDPDVAFEDLGNAIRKIRIDQGVDIEIDLDMVKRQGLDRQSRWHHAIGTIRYDQIDEGAPTGTLIYLKPSLTGDEPPDVQDYAAHHALFPHEPTSDQFFDESQFESYRGLGEHIAREVFQEGRQYEPPTAEHDVLSSVIDRLEKHWIPTPVGVQDSLLNDMQPLLALEEQLRTDPGLARYDVETYPEILSVFGVDPKSVDRLDVRSSLHLCSSQIQLMEHIFLGVRLGEHAAHPLNRGWMNLFRRWASAPSFRQWWPILCGSFSRSFVEFAERHLHLPTSAELAYGRRPLDQTAVASLRGLLDREWTMDPTLPELFEAGLRQPVSLGVSPGRTEPAVWLAWLKSKTRPIASLPFVDGELLGVVALSSATEAEWHVHGWVRPGYRNVGIGYRLFNHAMGDVRRAVENGFHHHVTLLTDLGPDDASAAQDHAQQTEWIRFYERLGFRRIAASNGYPRRIRLACSIDPSPMQASASHRPPVDTAAKPT